MEVNNLRLPKKIVKRDGTIAPFESKKITDAIFSAARAVGGEDYNTAQSLTLEVLRVISYSFYDTPLDVEEVQNLVEKVLIEKGHAKTAKAYILYRDKRSGIREARSDLMNAVNEILQETHRENANVSNSPSAKVLQISEAASTDFYLKRVLKPEHGQAHREGNIHIHDLSWYGKTLTCLQIPLGRLLNRGFNTGNGYIRKPKSIRSAAALACIILQSNQNDQHGGQSFAFFDRDLAPFVDAEFNRQRKMLKNEFFKLYPGAKDMDKDLIKDLIDERINKLAYEKTKEETFQAMEAFIYNCNSMHSRAGAQVPFSSIALGTDTTYGGRMITEQFLLAYEKGLGKGEQPIFPNVGFKLKSGINLNPGDRNYYLFRLAMYVAGKRLFPAFINLDASFNAKYQDEVAYMGCRTRVIANVNGPEVTDGRGNLSFTTINLPRIGIEAAGNWKNFYRKLDETVDLVIDQLLHRYDIQKNLKITDFPFLFGEELYLGSDALKPGEKIETCIRNGTLSMGFIGLAEILVAMTGKHHGECEVAQSKGLEIIGHLRRRVNEATVKHGLNFTLLATPAEGLSGKFLKMDIQKFGVIKGITDKEWYTNSFHVPVEYNMFLFDKIKVEAPYHKFCNAGHISYVEMASSMEHNLIAYEQIVREMHAQDMGYFAINFPVDCCSGCGHSGVIYEDNCPVCQSKSIKRIRRITGYLSTLNKFNNAKKQEEKNRVIHFEGN
ncbi:anaerobic ribonucleoside triphosphate reductase [Desulfitibacter alkalitolerans]|uniref:anaerobic ribonucleoside triphosphate reductase n=1 Tax=Desulfitibacter alkalitolerans TaxID=264641 RepID=UPI0004807EBF